ncbi:reverse transcriptase [Plakobranchus ocellatus]|uniref:Reverse transcriptase n=1 Tax=Plakobranchus ocellatus TaxID=259542 RepID=A0AAV4DAD6_9GAST|nr:reverse transcriptase [Plakobranchus ocellatus]
MSELTARLVKLGRDLGLERPELRAFVKEERDREEKREAQETQEKKEAQERQKKKEAQERQEKKEEQERKDKLELEKLKLQAEIENAKSLHSKKDSCTSDWIAKIPRMNPFSEAKGDTMDAFLFRFEMLVKAHNWPEDKKFLALSNLLTGESLKVLVQTLSVEQQTYACLKQALLKKFLCTAADYNVKFRTAVPTNTEDADAFISRLETVFDKWLELSNIEKGHFEGLRDLILRDQIYASLHKELVMFLKERSPISVKEVRNLADKYRTVHPAKPIAKEFEIVANVGVTKESKNNQEQFNRTSTRDKWQQNSNQQSRHVAQTGNRGIMHNRTRDFRAGTTAP